MKPYGKTDKDYGDTGCCPGHDNPYIKKWAGMYKGRNARKLGREIQKIQNRSKRRVIKEQLRCEHNV